MRQAKQDKEHELASAKRQAAFAQEELEQAQKDLSRTRVDIRKHEKSGYKKSIDHMRSLVAQVSALSQRLAETAIEHIEPTKHGTTNSAVGLRELLSISNNDIDRICAQAADFASDDHVPKLSQLDATLTLPAFLLFPRVLVVIPKVLNATFAAFYRST